MAKRKKSAAETARLAQTLKRIIAMNADIERLRRDCPLVHVLYAIEEKAKEIEALGALPTNVMPVRVLLEGFGSWAALFVLRELAACGDAHAQQWADDLDRSRKHYRTQTLDPPPDVSRRPFGKRFP